MTDTTPTVTDEGSRFAIHLDGHVAERVYRLEGDHLRLVHTGVPEELGGRGLGGVLVNAAVDRAEAEGLTIIPDCPFARGWLEKHPEDAARVTIDW